YPLAQSLLKWLLAKGLHAERTRMNMYGYPGIFRELFSPPPWVQVEPEDCNDEITAERAAELAPLYEHVARRPEVASQFKSYLAERRKSPLLEYLGANSRRPEWLDRLSTVPFDELVR